MNELIDRNEIFAQITIHGDRGDEWEQAVGTRTFPVRNLVPLAASLPGIPAAGVYLLDLEKIPDLMMAGIVAHLANKFGLSLEEAWREVRHAGIPILAENCTFTTNALYFL